MMETAFDSDLHREVVLKEEDIHCDHPSGVRIHGLPDRVEKLDDGTYVIVDFKTGRNVKHIKDDINTYDAKQAIDEIIREYRTPKNQPFEGKLSDALKGVVKVIENGGYAQDNGAPQDILNVLLGAEEVYCEVPFCYRDEEDGVVTVWNGVIDVIYCEGGNWHIIDYKTNIDGGNLDHKYKAQLEAYKKAFKATTGNDADAYTYHIDI